MERLGKYWGEDADAPQYQKKLVLDDFYQDVTCVELIYSIGIAIGDTLETSESWALEFIQYTGEDNLSEVDKRVAKEKGLI